MAFENLRDFFSFVFCSSCLIVVSLSKDRSHGLSNVALENLFNVSVS